jgi:Icc-related predicted phosphoesterase
LPFWKRLTKHEGPRTRLFFTTDIHGSTDCFRKFLGAASFYKADVLIIGGDITGKTVVPLVRQADGSFRCDFLGRELRLDTAMDLEQAETLITRSGGYPYRTEREEMQGLQRNPGKVEDVSKALILERVAEWVRLADEKLSGSGVRVFISAGNDDFPEVDDILRQSTVIVNHDGQKVWIDEDHEMIGLGYANITPWQCPRDISEEELACKIEALAAQVERMETCIFSFHVPPVDSQLDTCPKLDSSVYPPRIITDGSGGPVLHGAGSTAVRNAIEKYQPLLSLHGHIHESRGVVQIGRTKAFNPGSEYAEGIMRGVLVNLTNEHVLSYQFTSG